MKEIDFKYFIDGVEVDGNLINWEYSSSIISKGNEIYITYEPVYADYIYGKYNEEDKKDGVFVNDTLASMLLNTVSLTESKPNEKLEVINTSNYPREDNYVSPLSSHEISNNLIVELAEKLKGVKHNKHKAPISLLFTQFPDALEAIARCSDYGHQKYKETDLDFLNFKRVSGGSKTYADAGLRHRLEKGLDSESKLPHQFHIAWNALAELQLWIEEQKA